ncbi:MAG: hypothetical protein J6J17_01665 [Bacilli bacterium]|nr:hypothetical protein [Bacilli bacterium]
MKKLNDILSGIGISKVKLAKYLGVSRQMVYNYLEMDDINNWPLEKKMKLFNLLQIKSADEIDDLKITNDFIKHANNLINDNNSVIVEKGNISFDGLNSSDQALLNDIIFLLKEDLEEDDSSTTSTICKYLYYFLQAIENTPEIKYMLGYIAKTTGFINPNEFAFEEDNQFAFESILYSAIVLYNNGSASKEKLIESHKKFVQEIEAKHEEKLSRTQELTSARVQALKELGYTEINENNVSEVFEKMAEIQSRKI